MTFTAPGAGFKVHQDLNKFLYDKGNGAGRRDGLGEVLYNRMIVNAMLNVEAIRTAMAQVRNTVAHSEQVRWGFENLNITEERLGGSR